MTRSARNLVQFEDPALLIESSSLPGTLDEEATARLFGLSVQAHRELRSELEAGVEAAAAELGEGGFASGDLVAAVGDSLTADLQSWARLLAARDSARVLNRAVSGDTSTGAVVRFETTLRAAPDWIVVLIGTNDARRHGDPDTPMLVSNAETAANLGKLAALAAARTDARLIWMTPPPIIEELVARDPDLRSDAVWWRAEDVAAKAALVRERPETVVDLEPVLSPPRAEWFLEDGLHLSLAGQVRVARALLDALPGA